MKASERKVVSIKMGMMEWLWKDGYEKLVRQGGKHRMGLRALT